MGLLNHENEHEYTTSADLTKPKPSWEPKPAWGSVEPDKPEPDHVPKWAPVKTVAELKEIAADLQEMHRQYDKSREQLKGILVAQIESLMLDLESLGVYYRIEEVPDPPDHLTPKAKPARAPRSPKTK